VSGYLRQLKNIGLHKMAPDGWFPIMTRPRAEERAQEWVRDRGLGAYYPHFPSFHEWRGRGRRYTRLIKVPKRPLLPGYIFVLPELDGRLRFDLVRDAPWISAFVSPRGHEPLPLPPKAMAKIMDMTDPAGAVLPEVSGEIYKSGKIKFKFEGKIGDVVRLKQSAGPWAGFEAAIQAIDPTGQISIELQIFNRPTPVDVPVEDCELLPKPKAG